MGNEKGFDTGCFDGLSGMDLAQKMVDVSVELNMSLMALSDSVATVPQLTHSECMSLYKSSPFRISVITRIFYKRKAVMG